MRETGLERDKVERYGFHLNTAWGTDGVKVAWLVFRGPRTTEDFDTYMNGDSSHLDEQR